MKETVIIFIIAILLSLWVASVGLPDDCLNCTDPKVIESLINTSSSDYPDFSTTTMKISPFDRLYGLEGYTKIIVMYRPNDDDFTWAIYINGCKCSKSVELSSHNLVLDIAVDKIIEDYKKISNCN